MKNKPLLLTGIFLCVPYSKYTYYFSIACCLIKPHIQLYFIKHFMLLINAVTLLNCWIYC